MKKQLFLPLIIISLLLTFFKIDFSSSANDNLLSIHIIDVGQGDCILIQTPNKNNILVDSGDEDSFPIINDYLHDLNIKLIHTLVISHFDTDHIGSMDDIVNNFEVNSIYSPGDSKTSNAVFNLQTACSYNNLTLNYVYANDTIYIDEDISLHVLSPTYIQDNSNCNSIVFELNYLDKSFLFTGDCESENEFDIINSYDLENVDFLKVAHHGSKSSTTELFLDEVTPDIAAISCGYNNDYGHPHQSTIKNLSDRDISIFRTDLMGDLVFYSDGKSIFTKKNYLKE